MRTKRPLFLLLLLLIILLTLAALRGCQREPDSPAPTTTPTPTAVVSFTPQLEPTQTAVLLVTFYNDSDVQIGQETVWGAVDYQDPTFSWQSGMFTTPSNTATLRVGFAASVDNDVDSGWLLADRITLTSLSQPMPVTSGVAYTLSSLVQGELDGPSGAVSGQLAAYFYDAQGNMLDIIPAWTVTDYARPDTPMLQEGTVSHDTAVQMRVGTGTAVDAGWLSYENGNMRAFFSQTDNADEQGARLYAVIGRLGSEPEMRLRVGVYGYWLALPLTAVFTNNGPFKDLYQEKDDDKQRL